MDNPYAITPASPMGGMNLLFEGVSKGAEFDREKLKKDTLNKKRQEAAQIMQNGTPSEISDYAIKNPEIISEMDKAIGFKSELTKQNMIESARRVLIGGEDPYQVAIERSEEVLKAGGDATQSLELTNIAATNPGAAKAEAEKVLALYDPTAFAQYQKLGATEEAKDTRTPDIKNYEYAKKDGFKGSFRDFSRADKAMKTETTAEIRNYEYGLDNPDFAKLKISADENRLTEHELRLATMLANGEIDASQLPKRGATYNKIVSGAKELNPELDIRAATADYALSKNPQFRQKTMTAEVLPDIMKHVVDAGKKVDFSNIRKLGGIQKLYKENINDPDFVEYMALRNDALMEIASVMRGGGMTDKAHEAEVEAMNPTMSPRALDAWMKAQTKALKPRLSIMKKVISGNKRQQPKTAIPQEISTQEDFDRLAPGAGYLENGVLFRKPL